MRINRYRIHNTAAESYVTWSVPELCGAEVLGPLAQIHVDFPVLSGLAVHVVQNPLVAVPDMSINNILNETRKNQPLPVVVITKKSQKHFTRKDLIFFREDSGQQVSICWHSYLHFTSTGYRYQQVAI